MLNSVTMNFHFVIASFQRGTDQKYKIEVIQTFYGIIS
jgi:hypothetical protein